MRNLLLAAASAATLLVAPLLSGRAEAAPVVGLTGIGLAVQDLNVIESVQYVYRGRRFCWYPDGWNGPGWYWCGYRVRRGLGWGGPVGFRGWVYRAPGVVVVKPRPRRPRPPAVIIRP
jgi:hypothetical protein